MSCPFVCGRTFVRAFPRQADFVFNLRKIPKLFMSKKRLFITLFILSLLPASPAQGRTDTVCVFRFSSGKDMFFSLYEDNKSELVRLFECVEQYKKKIQGGEIPLHVDGYCTSKNSETANLALAKTRSNRVKSELITQKGLTEDCFITRNHAEKGDFVTVRIVVPKADIRLVSKEQPEEKKEETKEVVRQEKPQTTQETQPEEVLPVIKDKEGETYTLALRANLLRWVTLTPDIGVEWRINRDWGIQVNGSWTSWTWNGKERRYALWEVLPEVRYYIGKEKRGYVGAMYKAGQFNYKFSTIAKQGDLMGGGITGGYRLKLNRLLSLDFSLGIGCVHAEYDRYEVIDGVRVRQGKETKNWWGPVNAGVTLVWKLF